jgi:sec-independent protein translocase protein TatC
MSQLNSGKEQTAAQAGSMSFFDHLDELRTRLVRCLIVFFVGFVGCYFISEPIMDILRKPLFDAMPSDQRKLYFTTLFENFMTHLKISGYASLFFLSPYFFYELWKFISPGLYPRERKLVLPFVFAASVFFLGGALFAYYGLFPVGFHYFVTYGAPSDVPLMTIDSYYSTVLKLLLLFGIAFELPVLIVFFGYLGIFDAATLRAQRKPAIIGITVISALFAPPDAVSMIMLGAPLVLLYEASIWVVQWMGVRRPPAEAGVEGGGEPAVEPHPLEGRSKP